MRKGGKEGGRTGGREVTYLKVTMTFPFSLLAVYKGRVPYPLCACDM